MTWQLPAHLYHVHDPEPDGPDPDRAWLTAYEERERERMIWIATNATMALLGSGFVILRHEDTPLDVATLHEVAVHEGTPTTLRRRAVLGLRGPWSVANALATPALGRLAAQLPDPWTYRLPRRTRRPGPS